ncbi:hypothetical protein EB821_00505 [Candidatus Marinimicrobia bacterium PRS2]|nr:hypothetical protein EB821_00505 [Candidatus Marinimicrobia bacterium PRS2]
MTNKQIILSQDECLSLILKNINDGYQGSFIRKSDGENIVLSYGILNSIPFKNYRKKLIHYNISIWDISFQLFIRSELINAFSNASLLGVCPPGHHRHGFWEMEDDILSYFSLNNNRLGDVNFHMGFIKKPNNNELMNPIAQEIITNRKVGIISHCKVEEFLLQYQSKVLIRLEIPKRKARFQRMNRTIFNTVVENIKKNSQVDFWIVAAGIHAKPFCEHIRKIGGIGIDIGSSMDTWVDEYHSRGHLRKLLKQYDDEKLSG